MIFGLPKLGARLVHRWNLPTWVEIPGTKKSYHKQYAKETIDGDIRCRYCPEDRAIFCYQEKWLTKE